MAGLLARLLHAAVRPAGRLRHYSPGPPSSQQTADLFAGRWICRFPSEAGAVSGGQVHAFDDAKLAWGLARLGGIEGKTVVELGPLEGGHSYMLQRAGARKVVAIEANQDAYLRCLVVKEILGLTRVQFLLGDFIEYLRQTSDRFDVCIASGVLYHMSNPPELIELIARRATAAYCWTVYHDADRSGGGVIPPVERSHHGFTYQAFARRYGPSRHVPWFCGSGETSVTRMRRDDIERCWCHFGFSSVETGYDEPNHAGGPSVALVARKSGPPLA